MGILTILLVCFFVSTNAFAANEGSFQDRRLTYPAKERRCPRISVKDVQEIAKYTTKGLYKKKYERGGYNYYIYHLAPFETLRGVPNFDQYNGLTHGDRIQFKASSLIKGADRKRGTVWTTRCKYRATTPKKKFVMTVELLVSKNPSLSKSPYAPKTPPIFRQRKRYTPSPNWWDNLKLRERILVIISPWTHLDYFLLSSQYRCLI